MSRTESFWDLPNPDQTEVPRGAGGGPMLVPKGMPKDMRTLYTRASALSSYIEETEYIHRWEKRYLARGLGMRPDLAELAAVETYNTGLSNPVFGRDKSQSGKRLDAIIERALDAVGLWEKADRGTAIHAATEPGNHFVPEHLQEAVDSFDAANRVNGIRIIDTERFTANDITMSAGTFDHLVEVPGIPELEGCVIGDKKTGDYSPHEWAIQLSTYARGEPYNTDTDNRAPWPDEINLDYAIVWQIDNTTSPATTQVHVLDIQLGWEAAQHAAWVRDWHKRTDLTHPFRRGDFMARFDLTDTVEGLRTLWETTDNAAHHALILEKVRSL
jgi:hypothetical protein